MDRWAADIADAVEKLRHYVPDALEAAARDAAGFRGAAGGRVLIRAALAAGAEGAGTSREPSAQAGTAAEAAA